MQFELKNIVFNFMPDPDNDKFLLPSIFLPTYLPRIANTKENHDEALKLYFNKKLKVTITIEA